MKKNIKIIFVIFLPLFIFGCSLANKENDAELVNLNSTAVVSNINVATNTNTADDFVQPPQEQEVEVTVVVDDEEAEADDEADGVVDDVEEGEEITEEEKVAEKVATEEVEEADPTYSINNFTFSYPAEYTIQVEAPTYSEQEELIYFYNSADERVARMNCPVHEGGVPVWDLDEEKTRSYSKDEKNYKVNQRNYVVSAEFAAADSSYEDMTMIFIYSGENPWSNLDDDCQFWANVSIDENQELIDLVYQTIK